MMPRQQFPPLPTAERCSAATDTMQFSHRTLPHGADGHECPEDCEGLEKPTDTQQNLANAYMFPLPAAPEPAQTCGVDPVSEEEKLLEHKFRQFLAEAHKIGWKASPCLPKTAKEYAQMLIDIQDKPARGRSFGTDWNHSSRLTASESPVDGYSRPVPQQTGLRGRKTPSGLSDSDDSYRLTSPESSADGYSQPVRLFGGRAPKDGLSTVLAMKSCFNEIPDDAPASERVDWPDISEFKSWGAIAMGGRACRNVFPYPRINTPMQAGASFPNNEVPYRERKILFGARWDWISDGTSEQIGRTLNEPAIWP